MSEYKLVCPFLSNVDEDRYCIGSDCALWVEDWNPEAGSDYGCCSLACSGIDHNMVPMIYRDPAMGGDA